MNNSSSAPKASSTSAKNQQPERKVVRVPHGGTAVYKPRYGGNLAGKVRDVSEAGVYIISATHITVGSEILIYLPIETGNNNRTKMCIVAGKVVRIGKSKEIPGFAIEFENDLSKTAKEQLRGFVARHAKTA